MAYRLEEQKIIPGGLNLLAPGDQVAPGDCLDLTGFWPGAAGRLEQTPGYLAQTLTYVTCDSVCEASGRIYYGGAGNLYQVSRNAGAAIDTGYDGYPLGLISFLGYCWIMNQSKQRKDDGTTVTDWTPAAPGAPTVTNPSISSAPAAVSECDPANPGPDGYFTAINMFTNASVDGMVVGGSVTVAGNASAACNGTWIITAVYTGSLNLLVLKALLDPATVFGLNGTFTYATPGAALGDFEYYVTWQYPDLGESNPCAKQALSVTGAGTKVTVDISGLVVPSGVIGWNVYCKRPSLSLPYRVNTDVIPIATTSYDDFADLAHGQDDGYLQQMGAVMEADHDPAPAARIVANQTFNDRIVVANSAAYPNRIWYTPPRQPGFFRGSGDAVDGDWVDIGTDRGDQILFMSVRPNLIVVYRAKSIWRIIGDFDDPNGRIEIVVPDLGVVGPRAVVTTSIGDFFRGPESIYRFNGDWAQEIALKLEPVFRGQTTENFQPEGSAYRSNCALGFRNGRLWVTWFNSGGTPAGTFVYHTDTDRWFAQSTGYGAYASGTNFLGAAYLGVFTLETTDPSASYGLLAYQSAYIDCGVPDHQKTFSDLVLSHNTANQTLTLTVRVDKNADSFTLTTIQSNALTKQIIPLVYPVGHANVGQQIKAFNLSLRITGSGVNGTFVDSPMLLHYYLEARKGKWFDSDETNHGVERVKQLDRVELDVDASSGNATFQAYTDIPGGVQASRVITTINQTMGRQVQLLVLSPVYGRLIRYEVTTANDFQIYGMRARILPIGVYLDGTVGDYWQPQAISLGVDRWSDQRFGV